jgi:hypothetical protein
MESGMKKIFNLCALTVIIGITNFSATNAEEISSPKMFRFQKTVRATGFKLTNRIENSLFANNAANMGQTLFVQLGCDVRTSMNIHHFGGHSTTVVFDVYCPYSVGKFLDKNLTINSNDRRLFPTLRPIVSISIGDIKEEIIFSSDDSHSILWSKHHRDFPSELDHVLVTVENLRDLVQE